MMTEFVQFNNKINSENLAIPDTDKNTFVRTQILQGGGYQPLICSYRVSSDFSSIEAGQELIKMNKALEV